MNRKERRAEKKLGARATPTQNLPALFAAAVHSHQAGRLEEAERLFLDVLKADSRHVDALHALGILAHQRGRDDLAADFLARAVAQAPGAPVLHNNRGNALQALGRLDEAAAAFRRALALKPDFAEAHFSLGVVLQGQGALGEAVASFRQALALNPRYVQAHYNLGVALQGQGELDAAADCYRQALALHPGYVEAHYNLGVALLARGELDAAEASYRRALALQPDFAEAHNNLGLVLQGQGRREEALAAYGQALALKPDYAAAHDNKGNALLELGRPAEALASYDRALALAPHSAEAHDNRGLALGELGRFDEANAAIETAIRLAPRRARFYYDLTQSLRLTAESAHLQAMRELARDLPSLDANEQVFLHFALSQAFSDSGDRPAALDHLLAGNALKRRQIAYDEAEALAALKRVQQTFSRDLMLSKADSGDFSSAPIFIVGMPRSGSTLIEQILASHPKVFGAGEINAFGAALTEILGPAGFPEAVATLSGEKLRRLGSNYVGRIRPMAPSALRITDKMLDNFRYVGLIHMALPNARIIHARRDAIDLCLSCFSKLFAEKLDFTYDLGELGRYCRGYETLMAHWRDILPPGGMLEVDYEAVVGDLEGQARRIVAHCGLDWDARCLDFHRTERQVRTASKAQVRQPIYTSSVGRGGAFEPLLAPLRAALG